MDIPANGLRLNIGCGRWVLDGWVNIDKVDKAIHGVAPQIMCDVRSIPLPDECAIEAMAIHVWEHFYSWECDAVLAEWRRLLRPRGRLVLEMPDLMKCVRNVLEGRVSTKSPDQLGMWGLYGDPTSCDPLMMHRWGWTFATLEPFLAARGFDKIIERPTQWHKNGRLYRDFRIEAVKT